MEHDIYIKQCYLILLKEISTKKFTKREKQVFILRYGTQSEPPQHYKDAGNLLGISAERCSQIDKKIIKKLKENKKLIEVMGFIDD
jgi:DNA-directed RNA polymerase sigma subunit (sigma70/sigma32)